MPEVGSIIAGKYRIERPIGAGGMGTVVAATHVQLGTRVALKFLNERVKDRSSSLERFSREARACAQLRSEHVCRVSDFGVEGDVPYIAMELLDGTDLAKLLDSGPLDPATATGYVLQACAGLAEAHALGIVHRDLKPHNLFLARRPDGSPLIKVLDFGIAKIPVGDDHALTRTAHVVGSPGYMAPEQLRSSKTVDARADVWALGVILYELISRRHPFYADAVTEVALKIAMDEPPPLAEAPPGLQEVVMRCLAKEPDDRFSDVAALATALAPFASRGDESAAAIGRVLAESAETGRTMPQLPATLPEPEPTGHATVRDSPRARLVETTHQASAGEVTGGRPRQRRIAIGIGAVAAIGALGVAFALGRSSNDEPDEEVVAIDQAPSPPPIDAAVTVELEVRVTGVPTATIVVDGDNWGDGTRISQRVVVGVRPHQIQIWIRNEMRHEKFLLIQSAESPVRYEADLSTVVAEGGSAKVSAETESTLEPADAPKTDYDVVSRDAARAHSARIAKGLQLDDLGSAAGTEAAIDAALKRKDLATAKQSIATLNAAVAAIVIDRAFVLAKAERVGQAMGRHQLRQGDADAFFAAMEEVTVLIRKDDIAAANRKLNLIADEIAKRPPATAGSATTPPAAPLPDAGTGTAAPTKEVADTLALIDSAAHPAAIAQACLKLARLQADRVPWERCVTAQCTADPSFVAGLVAFAPIERRPALQASCRPPRPSGSTGSAAPQPKRPPAGSAQQPATDQQARQRAHADMLLGLIHGPYSAAAIVGACMQLTNLDLDRVPWDACIQAQCKLDPNGLPALTARGPTGVVFRRCP